MTYDDWKLATPWDDEPEPCECGEEDCSCAEEAEWERGDFLYNQMKDAEAERSANDD
jgi:hypothetical protein